MRQTATVLQSSSKVSSWSLSIWTKTRRAYQRGPRNFGYRGAIPVHSVPAHHSGKGVLAPHPVLFGKPRKRVFSVDVGQPSIVIDAVAAGPKGILFNASLLVALAIHNYKFINVHAAGALYIKHVKAIGILNAKTSRA